MYISNAADEMCDQHRAFARSFSQDDPLAAFPKLGAFVERFRALPQLAKYVPPKLRIAKLVGYALPNVVCLRRVQLLRGAVVCATTQQPVCHLGFDACGQELEVAVRSCRLFRITFR